MKILTVSHFLVLWFIIFSSVVCGQQIPGGKLPQPQNAAIAKPLNLMDLDEEVFLNPWRTYQKLLVLESSVDSMPILRQQWWHIRKAQCENLLYFYQDFNKSLQALSSLLTDKTSSQIKSRFLFFKGLSTQREGRYKQARIFFKQSMGSAKKVGLNHVYIRAKQELAYTYSLADLYDTSLKDMQEAFIEAFALNDHFLLATINETYGAIYGYLDQYQRSIEYYQKALETYEKLGYKAHVAEAIYGLASTYRYWKKYDLAITLFKRYQDQIAFTPNDHITYFGAYGLGMTLAEKGDCELALINIARAFELDGLDDYDAELYKRKASCLIKLGRLTQAEEALIASANIFDGMPELLGTDWHLEINKIRGQLQFARGEYQLAYNTIDAYYQAYNQNLINNSSNRVSNIRAGLELERQEVEKALEKQRLKAEALATKNRQQKALQQNYFIVFLSTLLVIVIAVVSVQYKNNRKMLAQSRIEPLTKLYNRKYIFEYLNTIVKKTSVEKGVLSVIVFDIDDFKLINDSYGHPVGDRILKMIASLALSSLRPGDMIGRIGGEEFMCVLPRADSDQSIQIAERMKVAFESAGFIEEPLGEINVTASFGVSTMEESFLDAETLFLYADQALYKAKRSGKNKVQCK